LRRREIGLLPRSEAELQSIRRQLGMALRRLSEEAETEGREGARLGIVETTLFSESAPRPVIDLVFEPETQDEDRYFAACDWLTRELLRVLTSEAPQWSAQS
jgi:hypothetical protein